MKACLVDNTQGINFFPVKHAPYISQDKDGNPITKKEAIYLTGILNLPIINQYFKATYSNRSFSINFDINIPKFSNTLFQRKIVKITLKLLKDSNNQILLQKLEDTYLSMLKNNSTT